MKKYLIILALIGVFSLFSSNTTQSQTYTITHDVDWATYNQNMWGPNGAPFNIDIHLPLFHIEFDTLLQMGWMDTTFGLETGAMFELSTWFVLGSTFEMYGWTTGWVDVEYPIEMDLTIPNDYTFNPGEFVTLNSEYRLMPDAELISHFPQAGVISLDLDFGFGLDLSADVCAVGICDSISIMHFEVPLDSMAIFYLNGQTGEVIYPCFPNGTIAFCHDTILPITFNNLWGIGLSGWVTLPYIETTDYIDLSNPCTQSLIANGDSTYMFLNLDIVQFLYAVAGLIPPPQGPAIQQFLSMLSGTYNLAGGIYIEYNLLSAWLDISNTMQQDLSFTPTVQTVLTFPTAVEYYVTNPHDGNIQVDQGTSNIIAFPTCCDLHYRYPCYGWPQFDIGYGAHLVSTFTNHVWDSIAFTLVVQALEFTFHIPFPYMKSYTVPEFSISTLDNNGNEIKLTTPSITNDEFYPTIKEEEIIAADTTNSTKDSDPPKLDWHIGPLIDLSLPLGYIPITWFNNTWELDGFNDTTFAGFTMIPNPEFELVSFVGNDNICFGDSIGSLTVTVQYGTQPYIYSWSHGVVDTSFATTNTQIGLISGTYTVTASDINGCTQTATFTIVDSNPPINVFLTATNVLCHGFSTGSVYSQTTGGTPGYTYLWDPDGQTTQNIYNLPAGTYTVTVTDQVTCTKTADITVTEPATYVNIALDTLEHVHCFGGNNGYIGITVTDGTPGYTYIWSNGSTNQDISGLVANTYTVTVSDQNMCTLTFSETVTQPPLLTVSLLSTNVTCFGLGNGTIDATVNGGTPPYTYNWSNGEVTEDLSSLLAGTYSLTVSDSYLCTASASVLITEPFAPLSATAELTHVLCHGDYTGAINLTPAGGTPPYAYSWSSGQTSQDLTAIPAGTYTVTVTDYYLCSFEITFIVIQPAQPLTASLNAVDIRCNGENNGEIDLTVTGGTPPYEYLWNTGSTEQDLDQLYAGYYRVTVTDNHGCTTVVNATISEPSQVIIDVTEPQWICIGQSATILISATGGTPWYNYFWSNGETDSIQIVSPTTTTVYSGYAVDTRGCIAYQRETTVHVYPPINAEFEKTNFDICNGEPVVLVSTSSGGNGNLIYTIGGNPVNMPHTLYLEHDTAFSITVSDNCGSPIDISFITVHIKPSPEVSFASDFSEGCEPFTVNFLESTPDVGQTYFWNFGDPNSANNSTLKNPSHIYENSGIYTVQLTVTLPNGCSTSTQFADMITVYPLPHALFTANPSTVNAINPTVKFINLSEDADTYYWAFGDGDTTNEVNPIHLFPSMSGNYITSLIAIGEYGCKDTVKGVITVKGDYTFYAPTAFTPDEDDKNEYFFVKGTNIDNNNFKLMIYDRWGEQVFVSKDINKGWNGFVKENRRAPIGTYTWLAIFRDSYGVKHEESGKVTIIW